VKLINIIQTFSGIALLVAASAVSAVPITGEIGMGGSFKAVDSSWVATSMDLATGIDFDPNLFIVNSATGSFSGVGTIGTIKDFQFTPDLGINDGFNGVTVVASIADFWAIDGFSFELTSVVKQASSSATFLDLEGTGIISGNGFDATPGSWSFNGENDATTFSWSAGSDSVRAVPEPAILALMGIGLIGFVASKRRV